MSHRRRRVLVILAVAALLWPAPNPRPGRATFRRVQPGATFAAVVASVGAAPDDDWAVSRDEYPVLTESHRRYTRWSAADATLVVCFGPGDRATRVYVIRPY